MIVDPSALMAILLSEPEEAQFLEALHAAEQCSLAAGSWVEIAAVLTRSRRVQAFAALHILMHEAEIEVEPTSATQAQIAHEAYRTYGMGTGHPARLKFGDCFAYALSRESGRPLLFKGDDFRHTDVESAV